MAKVNESPEYLQQQLQDLHGEFVALEGAAMVLADHNVKLRSFLLRLSDPEDLGHGIPEDVRKEARKLTSMERTCVYTQS